MKQDFPVFFPLHAGHTEESTIFLVGKGNSAHRINGVLCPHQVRRVLLLAIRGDFIGSRIRAFPVHLRGNGRELRFDSAEAIFECLDASFKVAQIAVA